MEANNNSNRLFAKLDKFSCPACGFNNLTLVYANGYVLQNYSHQARCSTNIEEFWNRITKYEISHLYCNRCKHSLHIDWRHGLPQPYIKSYDDTVIELRKQVDYANS